MIDFHALPFFHQFQQVFYLATLAFAWVSDAFFSPATVS
jgi:hypothetical protein